MTRRKPAAKLVILTGTLAQARIIAARQGLTHQEFIWPRAAVDLIGFSQTPLWLSPSLESHPRYADLADWVSRRLRALEAAQSPTQTPPKPTGLVLN